MAEDLLPLQFIREVHMAVKRAFPQAEVINAGGMPDCSVTREHTRVRVE
jgi:hypothetical protein